MKKTDDFERHLEEYSNDQGFVRLFEKETNKLRVAVKRSGKKED